MDWHGKNLKEILDQTKESNHLNELLVARSRNKKGASADELLNNVIHPTLEDLEFYLRYYINSDTDEAEMKKLISSWIKGQLKKEESGY
ncbi:MAG: hypothetical protein PHI15_02955 [Methanomicrobium sp.]|nr:hypothetical protein [Methanomicrobium sp.]